MMVTRNAKRVGWITFLAGTALCSISWASSIGITTNSGSQDANGHNSGVNENIANGVPDPGNGATGSAGWLASGSVSGNLFTDSALSQSSDPTGITSGLAIGSASLVNATVHAYTATLNDTGFDFNQSGYQSSARVNSNWVESLTWQPLPGNAVGSLVPVTFNIFADTGFFDNTAFSGFTSFFYSVLLPDIRDGSGNSQGSQLRWSSDESSDGFGDVSTHNNFCTISGTCYNAPSLSGTNGFETFAYGITGGLGIMTATVQGYAVSGSPFEVGMGIVANSSGDDAYIDFANTGWLTIDSPAAFTSQSGVFLSQPYSLNAPEPATALYLLPGLAAIVWLRRKDGDR